MWTVEYAPKSIDDVIMPDAWRREFEAYLPKEGETEKDKKKREKKIPHMLFAGPPGMGKTTIAGLLLPEYRREYGGSKKASAEDIRGLLGDFFTYCLDGIGIVFIDEAEVLSTGAQNALKKTIEECSHRGRFILATNYKDRLDTALLSRLTLYDFDTVSHGDVLRRVQQILTAEYKTLPQDVIDRIITEHHPDIRKIIGEVERECMHHTPGPVQQDSAIVPLSAPSFEGEESTSGEPSLPSEFFDNLLNPQRIAERIKEYWRLREIQIRCIDGKIWMVWTEGVWRETSYNDISQSVLGSIRRIHAAYEEKNKATHNLDECLTALFNAESQRDKIIRLLSGILGIYVPRLIFDYYEDTKWLIGFENGVYDFQKKGLYQSDPRRYISKCLPCNYNPDATCPKWRAFLEMVFDEDKELIDFVQRALGYSLIGGNMAQCIFIMLGEKARNGKSTFINIIKNTLGDDYYKSANESTFTKKSSAAKGMVPEGLHRLRTARFIGVSETEKNAELDVALVKKIAGGDDIVSRTLYNESVSYIAQYTVWIATNHMPKIDSTDYGLRRKVWVIRFDKQIPQNDIVPNYHEHLIEEREGILAWMIEGCRQYVDNGQELEPPDGVRPEYIEPELPFPDKVNMFIEECTELGQNLVVSKEMLLKTFLNFTEYPAVGEVVNNDSNRKKFGQVMSDLGYNPGKENTRVQGKTVYNGLRLQTPLEMGNRLVNIKLAKIDASYDKKKQAKDGFRYNFLRADAEYAVWTFMVSWCNRRDVTDAAYETYEMFCINNSSRPFPFEEWYPSDEGKRGMLQENQWRDTIAENKERAHAAVNEVLKSRVSREIQQ